MYVKLIQLIGIAHYELRLQWARRSLFILGIGFALIILLFLLLVTSELQTDPVQADNAMKTAATFALILTITPVSLLFLLLTLPPLVADAIAKDHSLNLVELRRTLPITPGIYLTGKLLGVWTAVTLMICLVATTLGMAAWLLLGLLHWAAHARIWLTVIMPASLFAAGLSVLLAAGQPTRKRATLVGGFIGLYGLFSIIQPVQVYDWSQAAKPSAWSTLALWTAFHYLGQQVEPPASIASLADVPAQFIWQTMVAAALQLLLVWLLVWGWWHWRHA